jgi:hypothetical protein
VELIPFIFFPDQKNVIAQMSTELNNIPSFFPSFVLFCKDEESKETTKQHLKKIDENIFSLKNLFSSNLNSRKWTNKETKEIGNNEKKKKKGQKKVKKKI